MVSGISYFDLLYNDGVLMGKKVNSLASVQIKFLHQLEQGKSRFSVPLPHLRTKLQPKSRTVLQALIIIFNLFKFYS
jgi:hypothetical protein